jgi:hypothetical protein
MPAQYRALSQADVDHFLEHGFVHLKDTFSPDKAQNWMTNMWMRLGMSPDAARWPIERCNMAGHTGEDVKEFAPKVWDAMCDLLGSGERINGQGSTWSDALVVNLGDVEGSTRPLGPRELNGWHVDGDFFTHFLDSPEQALLVVPLLTDVEEGQGPTVGATDSIAHIAKYLVRLLVFDRTGDRDSYIVQYEHPEGVTPRMTPKNSGQADDMNFFINLSARCEKFVHVTGKVGDCYLLHPLTLHTASRNCTRVPRVILNPAVSLAEPFNFDRANPDDYSLVERKTLLALGKPEGLKGWRVTGKREHVTPARIRLQATLKALELRRLRGEAVDATTNDGLGGKGLADVNRLEE